MIGTYKYPFSIKDDQVIALPREADVIHVGLDPQGTPCIWAVVDTEVPTEKKNLYVRGTGHPLPDDYKYAIGSFMQGPFMWHVFLD